MEERFQERAKNFREPPDSDKFRRHREAHAVELRKQKRSTRLEKRRALATNPSSDFIFHEEWVPDALIKIDPRLIDASYTPIQRLSLLLSFFKASDPQFDLRVHLSCLMMTMVSNKNFPYSAFDGSDIAQIIPRALIDRDREIVKSAVYCAANITYGSSQLSQHFAQNGIIDILIDLFGNCEDFEILDVIVSALYNLMHEPEMPKLILSKGFASLIIDRLNSPRIMVGLISSMLRFHQVCFTQLASVPGDFIAKVFLYLPRFLCLEDNEILLQALNVAFYATENANNIHWLFKRIIIERILTLMAGPSASLQEIAMKILGNISVGHRDFMEELFNLKFMDILPGVLETGNAFVRQEVLFAISNIATDERHALIVAQHQTFQFILRALEDVNADIRLEAIYCIQSLAYKLDLNTLLQLHSAILESLARFLDTVDSKLLEVGLRALYCVLSRLKQCESMHQLEENFAIIKLDECGGITRLEMLQQHPHGNVNQLAYQLIKDVIGYEVEETVSYATDTYNIG